MTPRCLSDDRCGRTAYPVLTGQRTCGEFSWEMLNQHMGCSDAERTLPVCARKPVSSVNTSKAFREMPASYRLPDHYPPVPALERAWVKGGSRQMFAGGRGSGAALHFHNAAYNVQFFGVKRCNSPSTQTPCTCCRWQWRCSSSPPISHSTPFSPLSPLSPYQVDAHTTALLWYYGRVVHAVGQGRSQTQTRRVAFQAPWPSTPPPPHRFASCGPGDARSGPPTLLLATDHPNPHLRRRPTRHQANLFRTACRCSAHRAPVT